MAKFQAGNLDRKIRILQRTKTKARSGQEEFTYSLFHECFAHLVPLNKSVGTEKNEDMALHEIGKMTFLTRYKAGTNAEMIIYYDFDYSDGFSPIDFNAIDFDTIRNKIYNIKSVIEPENTRRQWHLIETIFKD